MASPARVNVSERLRRIESITDAALAHLDFEELLEELLDRICELLDVETSAVLLLDDSAQLLVPTATRGLEDEIRQGIRIPVGKGFAGRIAAQRQPVILERVDRTTVVNPILIEKGIRTLLGVPLLAGRSLLGVLHVGSRSGRKFFDEDVKLLQLAAERVALATHVRLAEMERATTEALQRSLVPTRLPALPGLDLAARYVPGEGNGVGGDWYDLFVLPSGWPCLVIGDVVGHGLRAAVVMGRLRSALRAYALEGADPATVLTKLDRKVLHFEPGAMATVLYAMFEPGLERLHVSSAGHLPPVLATPGDEAAKLMELPIDPPLGVRLGQSRRTSTIAMPAGAVLCCYTDGLVERRGGNIDDGLRRLCAVVQARPAEDVCAAVMSAMVGSDPTEDDAAILMVRRETNVELAPLELVLAAVPTSVREARVAARHWLATAGAAPEDRNDLLIVLGEAVSNSVEHAYGPRGGEIHVRLEHTPPDVLVTVRDYGTWREPRGRGRGNGTTLIRACSDEADIEHGPSGTVVRCRRHLTGQDAR